MKVTHAQHLAQARARYEKTRSPGDPSWDDLPDPDRVAHLSITDPDTPANAALYEPQDPVDDAEPVA